MNYAGRTPIQNPDTCPHLRRNPAHNNKAYCYDCCTYIDKAKQKPKTKKKPPHKFGNTETCLHMTTNPIGKEGKAYCCDCGVYIDLNEIDNSTSSSETKRSDKSSSNTRENKTKSKVRPLNESQQSIGKMMFATALTARLTHQNTITDKKNNKQKVTTASENSINYMNNDAKETLKRTLLQETNRSEYFRRKEMPQANIAVIRQHITTKRHKSLESKETENKKTRLSDKCDVIRYTEGLWRQQEECIDKSSLNVIRPTKRKSKKNRRSKEDIGQARIKPEIIQRSEEHARKRAWELYAELNESTEKYEEAKKHFFLVGVNLGYYDYELQGRNVSLLLRIFLYFR
jgi:hypothetical protein